MRPVTQGDVIRADPKEIPRIFQLLYAGEGEARRPDEQQQLDVSSSKADERPLTLQYKGELSAIFLDFSNAYPRISSTGSRRTLFAATFVFFTMRTHKFPLATFVFHSTPRQTRVF